jgi:hypothetical protein
MATCYGGVGKEEGSKKETEEEMATIEPELPSGEIQVCKWCRAAMHGKCIREKTLTGVCVCNCARGW